MTQNRAQYIQEGELILGELAYTTKDYVWKAIVTQASVEPGESRAYQLWIQLGNDNPIRSGVFVYGKALVKYVKSIARVKFGKVKPDIDTLQFLADKNPTTVVPRCLGALTVSDKNPLSPECVKCPYKGECSGEEVVVSTAVPVESDASFLKRLQKKIAAKVWE